MTMFRSMTSRILGHPLLIALLVAALFFSAGRMSGGTVQILSYLMINILLAQSMNLLTGVAGQISLGHAGFYGVGAYGSAILMKTYGVPFAISVPMAAVFGALVGYALSFPAGRVREFYLAMMTLAFGLIFREVVRELDWLTGGAVGLTGVPSTVLRNLNLMGFNLDPVDYFRLVLLLTVAIIWMTTNFIRSHYGRSFYAIQVGEIAAGSLGIPRANTKRLAYAISGGIAGIAGGLYAHMIGYLGPESFYAPRSIEILVMTVVGGLGSVAGQIMSATLFTFLPEKLQVFVDYQFIVYGLILTFTLIVLPRGLSGLLLAPPRFIKPISRRMVSPADDGVIETPHAEIGGALVAEGVTVRFGGLTAVDGVSLRLEPGSITALIGPNGSGKSTFVNALSGLYRPKAGTVTFRGMDITGLPDHQIARLKLVRTFQDPRLVPQFTVRENLLLGAHMRYRARMLGAMLCLPAAIREERAFLAEIETILDVAGLKEVADQPLESLPYGYRRLVEVGRALMTKPHAIMLDEPAAGLSEVEIAKLGAILRWMKSTGMMVLLIEHHMDFVAEIVDGVVVLESGRVIYTGDIAGMRRNPDVIAAYLGVTEDTAELCSHA